MQFQRMSIIAACLLVAAFAPLRAQSQPLTLTATIRRVLETHPAAGAAGERVRASRGSRLTARSWTNPTITYQVEHEPSVASPTTKERRVSAFAMLPLEPIYQLGSRASRAGAEVRRAEADLRDTRRQLALAAASAFHRVASARVAVEATEDVQRWLDSLITYTRIRVREGVNAEADLIRLEVEQGRAGTELAMARIELVRARSELGVLVGMDSVTIDATADSAGAIAVLPALPTLIALALKHRPDLASAQANLDAMRAGVGVERSAIVREVGAMAGVMEMSGTRFLMAGVSLPFPLFDQNRGEIQRAAAERRLAGFEHSLVKRQITADVVSAYDAARSLSGQAALIGTALVQRAEEGRRIAEGAYREGATPLVQVLDAARAYADARMLYYRLVFARHQSLIELSAAVGSDDPTMLPLSEGR